MSHELLLLFQFEEIFIDDDGNDCTSQYPQYLAENIIVSGLSNPEFIGANYDGQPLIDQQGRVLQDIVTKELEEYGYIYYKDGEPYVQTKSFD